ncbi:MAG: endonuclease/exonuclease/phosphatase family protein [Ramlibacter sp.]
MNLVTWNTQWCCGIDRVVSPQRIAEGARKLADFDVLCLQEISINYPGLLGNPGHDQVAILRGLLPGFQFFFGAAVDEFTGDGQRRQFGNLVATRLPVTQVQHYPLPYPADGGVRSMPRMCTVVTLRDPQLGPLRVMTTHLEFYSKPQRVAQAQALRDLHLQARAQATAPPECSEDGSPFQSKVHTPEAILCGDFNLEPSDPGYAVVRETFHDAWRLAHGDKPHTPTFHVHDSTYSPVPAACDFVFVSDGLKDKVKSLRIDSDTQASDHQPVAVEFG